ncbi:vWA domain-containing protein [Tundrisphaera sp. TA3]|uniref:vWA domain-containing protein n=1 Tax=Tundrisphaera sp. TA3 TaxID=3435775 RepID=UPI003EBCE45B
MPALYRMPVFYLALMVGAVAFGLGRGRTTPEAPAPAVVAAAPARPPEVPPPPDDGILRTPGGLRRKVLVKDLAVTCRADPGGTGPAVGPPLDYFAIRYVFGEKAGSFRVGTRDGGPQGWIPAGSALEWDTRLMARPTPRAGRPALVIYRERDCLAVSLANRPCPRHPGGCPTEGEESDGAGSPGDGVGPTLGFPILETQADGGHTLFEVASLVRDQAPPPQRAAEPPPDLRPALRSVYVAFAIDTTKSMQATIDAARRLAGDLARSASERHGDIQLRLALVEYRDADPRYGFRARVASRFMDPRGFLEALGRINAATRGDGSVSESVLDGVDLALPGDGHVDWPGGRMGQFATKLLVLLGDAPDHARDLDRARALAARAKAAGISIATVAIDRPGTLSRDEVARYRAQWQTLADESYRPLDKATGYAGPIPPLTLELSDGGNLLVDRLQTLIDDRIDRARTLAAMAEAEAEGRLREYVDSRGLTLDRVAPILVDLHRADEPRAPARPDPRHDGRKAPSVRRGWIAEKAGGRPLVEVGMLMTRDELTALIDELARLQQAATGYARGLSDLLPIGTAAATGETSFLDADRGRVSPADHLRRRQELPPARPDSLLGRAGGDLRSADPLALAALEAKLRAGLLTLSRRHDDDDWTTPRRTVDGMALVPYAAIDF